MPKPQKKPEPMFPRGGRGALWDASPAREAGVERPKDTNDAPTTPDVPAPVDRDAAPPPPKPRAASPAYLKDHSASGEQLAIGSLVGARYVIEQHISSGGFGAVYRASDREIRHHQVALKLLHHRSASEEERQSALRELKLLATVTHPSVVQFKEYGWHEGRLWFAMPWYRGQTLNRILDERTLPSEMSRAEARPLFTRLAHGLAAMHAVGVHHHDIKPENIFVAEIAGFPGGLPVLLDLGIATQRGEHPIGLTVEYASPETAAAMLGDATRTIGGAADVYSLALVLRNVLDSSLVEPGETKDIARALRRRARKPLALSQKRELAYLVPHFRRWLSLDPNQRPTAAELAQELAVLTEPEERRKGRVRFLQRVAPGLMLLGLTVSGLALQLNRKETALVVQSRELQRQRQVGKALQIQSAAQLELSARKLGDERQQLQRALARARALNDQLAAAAGRLQELDLRKRELTAERDHLALEKDRLSAERDALSAAQAELSKEHETLVARSDQLSADLTKLSVERDDIARERDDLSAGHERAGLEIKSLEQRMEVLTKERDRLMNAIAEKDEKQASLTQQRAEALAEVRSLKSKLSQADTQHALLERKVRRLEARPTPESRPPQTLTSKKKQKPRKRAQSR